ncbi:hypothetical protein L6452_16418 [Arctium lappa]|uniref:Uncharacterized protein n=1 Tax=Arctium lappa TaxID=4217 RepID=A0ACB9C0L5_ARCLA|nr:hypothetical protein L6452_16418 [Arctium lappa]
MCRGFQQTERDRLLTIKSFYLTLSLSTTPKHDLPDSLTLHYLPRINGTPLEINDSLFRPDSPAFLTLYRLFSNNDHKSSKTSVTYGSREKVRVSEGVRFEVYLTEEKVVKGGFRKDEEGEWKMECRCGLEGEVVAAAEVKKVEVCVAVEGEVEAMRETVEMVVRRKRGRCFEGLLEEIPEQWSEGEEVEEGGCCCCECGGDEVVEDGGEVEVEGVRWAVDVGIWVVCLGVGYLVSKASSKSLRRRRLL